MTNNDLSIVIRENLRSKSLPTLQKLFKKFAKSNPFRDGEVELESKDSLIWAFMDSGVAFADTVEWLEKHAPKVLEESKSAYLAKADHIRKFADRLTLKERIMLACELLGAPGAEYDTDGSVNEQVVIYTGIRETGNGKYRRMI